MVNVNNLSIKFNDTQILEDISFSIKNGRNLLNKEKTNCPIFVNYNKKRLCTIF